MPNILSNPEEYAENWTKESDYFNEQNIYEKLADIVPNGSYLEFGCGVGNGTYQLVQKGNVLVLDNNQYLIEKALTKKYDTENTLKFHKCDFFEITNEDKKNIMDFSPTIIIGWFLGSHGEDIYKRTIEQPNPVEKGKLYREKIEDIIISEDICLDSVEYIHLANRGFSNANASEEEMFISIKQDYDTHVFNKIDFEVIEVKTILWDMTDSEFQYLAAKNPNFKAKEIIPTVTSILARRKK